MPVTKPNDARVDYTTRVGTARPQSAATSRNLHRLPYRESNDDGRILLHIGDFSPPCSDCEWGTLVQTQTTHHMDQRICDGCGSHWELHPVVYFMRREAERRIEIDLGCFQGGLREPSHEEHVDGEGSPTHGTMLGLLRPGHVSHAIARAGGGIAHIDACWARRQRFY